MFARSVTISGARPGALDQGIAYLRHDVLPELMELGGVGLSVVVDRDAGDMIVTSSWETVEAREATRESLAPYRDKTADMLGGLMSIADWEVALMHRDHDAFTYATCRVTWARTSDVDHLLETYRSMMLPTITEAVGFCSASMLVDRDRGIVCGTTSFDSRATLEASRPRADANRARTREFTDVEFTSVREFDLVLAHLRVPEHA